MIVVEIYSISNFPKMSTKLIKIFHKLIHKMLFPTPPKEFFVISLSRAFVAPELKSGIEAAIEIKVPKIPKVGKIHCNVEKLLFLKLLV